jgi:type I restriction enzyme M protein
MIRPGDVLVNGTGVGTIGRAAPYLHTEPALPDNHVTVLRVSGIDPIFLSVYLNGRLGQLQFEQQIKGSSGQIELYPDEISRILVWDAPEPIQAQVRRLIFASFEEETRAHRIQDIAKTAVEISLSQDDSAALNYLKAA